MMEHVINRRALFQAALTGMTVSKALVDSIDALIDIAAPPVDVNQPAIWHRDGEGVIVALPMRQGLCALRFDSNGILVSVEGIQLRENLALAEVRWSGETLTLTFDAPNKGNADSSQ